MVVEARDFVCSVCGKPFKVKAPNARYCSPECKRRAKREGASASKVPKHEKQCVICGVIFCSVSKKRKTCSPLCYRKYKSGLEMAHFDKKNCFSYEEIRKKAQENPIKTGWRGQMAERRERFSR